MINLNHGGTNPPQQDVSEAFLSIIDPAIIACEEIKQKRGYLGASLMGEECLRKLQYQYFNTPKDSPFSARLYRIFQFGHVIEDMAAGWFRLAGFSLLTINPETGSQFEISAMGGKFMGHCDGVFTGGPDVIKYPALWECKSMNNKKWTECKTRGARVSHPDYVAQIALYQAYFNLVDHPAVFTAVNKDTSKILIELVEFDGEFAQKLSDKAVQVIQASDAGELLPRAYRDETFYKCRFCDWNQRCWK